MRSPRDQHDLGTPGRSLPDYPETISKEVIIEG